MQNIPGGPWNNTPFGGVIWKRSKTSGYIIGKTTISLRQWICDSKPPTSLNLILVSKVIGFISALRSGGPPWGIADCLQ